MSVAPAPLSAEDEAALRQIESGDQLRSNGADREVPQVDAITALPAPLLPSLQQPQDTTCARTATDDEEAAQPLVRQTQQEHGRGFRVHQDPKTHEQNLRSASLKDGVENNQHDHESMCNGCLLVCEDLRVFLLPVNLLVIFKHC